MTEQIESLKAQIMQSLEELQAKIKASNASFKKQLEAMGQKCKEAMDRSISARSLLDEIIPDIEKLLKEVEEKQCQ